MRTPKTNTTNKQSLLGRGLGRQRALELLPENRGGHVWLARVGGEPSVEFVEAFGPLPEIAEGGVPARDKPILPSGANAPVQRGLGGLDDLLRQSSLNR